MGGFVGGSLAKGGERYQIETVQTGVGRVMPGRRAILGAGVIGVALAGAAWWWHRPRPPRPLSPADLAARYRTPLSPPAGGMAVYHLGHSLVGRDMPLMLQLLAGPGHGHASQLGWGASLRQHWEPSVEVPGFAQENAHPAHRPAHEAIGSGQYDAVVLTEMVEIRDAIRYHDTPLYLAHWARAVRAANPGARVYLYETWHRLDDPAGWLARIDADRGAAWEAILRAALARDGVGAIHVIPAGQAMAALVRRIEQAPDPGLSRREDLFARTPDGTVDLIHLGDAGAWFVAMVHFATLYHRPPPAPPGPLIRADGSEVPPPGAGAVQVMQEVAWQVVTGYALTGVAPSGA
jgi:hypothetical protein